MATQSIVEKLRKAAAGNQSSWLKSYEDFDQNRKTEDFLFEVRLLIAQILRAKDITQKDLAEKLKVSPQWINKVLRGKENLSVETIIKIGEALETDLITVGTKVEVYTITIDSQQVTALKGRKGEPIIGSNKAVAKNFETVLVKGSRSKLDPSEQCAIAEN